MFVDRCYRILLGSGLYTAEFIFLLGAKVAEVWFKYLQVFLMPCLFGDLYAFYYLRYL